MEQAPQGRPVYVVDDDEAARRSLVALLAAHGFSDVEEFASGERFLDVCRGLPAGRLLLDVGMSRCAGPAVLLEMQNCCPDNVAVMVTGSADIRAAVASMKAGAVDVIEKPGEPPALLAALHVAAERLEQTIAASGRVAAARALIDRLSQREREVLEGLASGDLNKVLAHKLGISPRTVEIHRASLMKKLGARRFPEALSIAIAAGVVNLAAD